MRSARVTPSTAVQWTTVLAVFGSVPCSGRRQKANDLRPPPAATTLGSVSSGNLYVWDYWINTRWTFVRAWRANEIAVIHKGFWQTWNVQKCEVGKVLFWEPCVSASAAKIRHCDRMWHCARPSSRCRRRRRRMGSIWFYALAPRNAQPSAPRLLRLSRSRHGPLRYPCWSRDGDWNIFTAAMSPTSSGTVERDGGDKLKCKM